MSDRSANQKNAARLELVRNAVMGNDIRSLENLLALDRSYVDKCIHGVSLIIFALKHYQLELVKLILGYYPNLDAKDSNGCRPLALAAYAGDKEIVRRMLVQGAHIEAKDNEGGTALASAAKGAEPECLGILLDKGAVVDSVDHHGWTPLFHAISSGSLACVQLLLNAGADVMHSDKVGRNVLEVFKPIDNEIKSELERAILQVKFKDARAEAAEEISMALGL